jgi:hypothetical protein
LLEILVLKDGGAIVAMSMQREFSTAEELVYPGAYILSMMDSMSSGL